MDWIISVLHYLLEFVQTHVHWVGDAIQLSHHLFPHSFFSCPQSFPASGSFPGISSSHQVIKVLEFQLQYQSFQWIFRVNFLYYWLVWPPCCPGNSQEPYMQHQSDQIRSVTQSYPTLCDPMNRSTPGLPAHHQLPEFTETHIHRVSDAIQPSHPLSSPSPLAPSPSQHQSLFQWVSSTHEVAKVLEFQLQHQSFQRNPRADLLQNGLVGSSCSPKDSRIDGPFKWLAELASNFVVVIVLF